MICNFVLTSCTLASIDVSILRKNQQVPSTRSRVLQQHPDTQCDVNHDEVCECFTIVKCQNIRDSMDYEVWVRICHEDWVSQ